MNKVGKESDLHHLQVVYCVSAPPINGPITRPSCETRPVVNLQLMASDRLGLTSSSQSN